jgi:4'-phosphopantetheinyl transferase
MFPEREVHIFRVDRRAQPARWRADAMAILSEEERARTARFFREDDAMLFALCRATLRILLGRNVGAAPEALAFESGPFGKPFLSSAQGTQLRFNVSHSGGVALIAVALGREVGVDVEAVRPIDDLDGLVRSTFSARERAAIFAAPDRAAAFFATWARKEAVVKALGLGLSFPLDAFDVEADAASPAAILESRASSLEPARWLMHELPPTRGFASALAVERVADSHVVFEEWTFPE